jgi:hypothetical protein
VFVAVVLAVQLLFKANRVLLRCLLTRCLVLLLLLLLLLLPLQKLVLKAHQRLSLTEAGIKGTPGEGEVAAVGTSGEVAAVGTSGEVAAVGTSGEVAAVVRNTFPRW